MFPSTGSIPTSPRSSISNIINLTITNLPQITSKISQIDESLLQNLDENIMKYVETRNTLKKPVLEDLQQQTLTIDNLNLANLNLLHNQSQCALLALDQQLGDFQKVKENIQDLNNRVLRDFIVAQRVDNASNNSSSHHKKFPSQNNEHEQQKQHQHQQQQQHEQQIILNGKNTSINSYHTPHPPQQQQQQQEEQRTLLDILKDLIIELSKYRDIEQIITQIQEIKKRNKRRGIGDDGEGELLDQVKGFIQQLDEVISSDDDGDQGYRFSEEYYERDHHGESISQLQYIE